MRNIYSQHYKVILNIVFIRAGHACHFSGSRLLIYTDLGPGTSSYEYITCTKNCWYRIYVKFKLGSDKNIGVRNPGYTISIINLVPLFAKFCIFCILPNLYVQPKMCTITKRARRHFVWLGAVLFVYTLLISAQYGAKVKRLYSGM